MPNWLESIGFGQKPEIKRFHTKKIALDTLRGRIWGFAGKG
jgi:hypothetical protein